MAKRIAIIGGGIAGVTAAWQLARLTVYGADIEATLFESSTRLGGIVETVRADGFTIECGPDAWVTEKPWAHHLAEELGLGGEIIPSNDAIRKTYILIDGKLVAIPDGMRMMVPASLKALDALDASSLFTESAKAAFRSEVLRAEELKSSAAEHDESVASFVERHFGAEVLAKIGAPLLSGVFGGDVGKLSVRAVMAPFVSMEREHGSVVLALEERTCKPAVQRDAVFTTLRSGTGKLIDAMVAQIPPSWIRLESRVISLARTDASWRIETSTGVESFDDMIVAAPIDVARSLLHPIDSSSTKLMQIDASSAVVVGLGFSEDFHLPPGFGFLVPPESNGSLLLAGTFVDQKFDSRVPAGKRLLRGFFGGPTADRLFTSSDGEIAALAIRELESILGPLPKPTTSVVRRWPRALPQYAVGHLERMAELSQRIESLGNLWLIGNGYRGVGLPDLIRDARVSARAAAASSTRNSI